VQTRDSKSPPPFVHLGNLSRESVNIFSRKIDAFGIRLKPVPSIGETLRKKLAVMEDKEEEEAINLCAFGASSSYKLSMQLIC